MEILILAVFRHQEFSLRGECWVPRLPNLCLCIIVFNLFPVFRIVYPQRKKDMKLKEVVVKKYVVSMDKFYFGPLLCGKSRDK